jgi:uncharacterized cupredoxin-like copper-binding protein
MFCESFMIDPRHHTRVVSQRAIGRLYLLSIVLLSSLLYAAMGAVVAGEGPIPIVEVKLAEFTIEMPTTAPPGGLTFSVTNAGTTEHNFEVEGQGIQKKFDTNLKPGETRNLQVELPAGTYKVYCPLENHKERGIQLELKVAQQQSG